MTKINKAIITAAGYGTRFFPITKTIQKEMLPILARPIIDYVVEDCIKAGIKEIIFVTKPNDTQIKNFYSESRELYAYLKKMNKVDKYESIKELHTKAKFSYVFQKDSDPYGTAVPLQLVKNLVKNEEAFLMFMGDDFIYNSDNSSEAARMIDLFNKSNAKALINCIEIPKNLSNKYGIVEFVEKNGFKFLKDIVEKPEPNTAPSNLANISKYIFTPRIFDILDHQKINLVHGELLITDTFLELAKKEQVIIHVPNGEYLDGGYVLGWLEANLILAKNNVEIYKELTEFIKKEFLISTPYNNIRN